MTDANLCVASVSDQVPAPEPGVARMVPEVKGQQQLIRGLSEVPQVVPKGLTRVSATLNVSVISTLSKQTNVAPSKCSLNGPLSNAFDPGVVTFLVGPSGESMKQSFRHAWRSEVRHIKRPFLCDVGNEFICETLV